MVLPIVHHPAYDAPLDPDHRFPMGKFRLLARRLEEAGLVPHGFHAPEPASEALLARAHDPAYVRAVLAADVAPFVAKRIGLPITPPVALRAQTACGGTLLAARLALEHGLACNTAGGSHHAGPAGGAGFCVFNDVAAAALALLDESAVRRVLVIDLDVHQGDGTAAIFADDARVFTFSMHAEKNYPSRKAASDWDIGLPDGMEDAAYLDVLAGALPQALARAAPDIVFYVAGVDPHKDDGLGRLALSDAGLRARERMVIAACQAHAVAMCGVLGGGYGPAETVAARHAILHEEAAAAFAPVAAPAD